MPRALEGDPDKTSQVLANLVSNAIKFTDDGEVTVHVERVEQTPRTTTLRFEIRDTGIGIALEDHPRLFDTFTQVDQSNRRAHGGTGLGLAICRELVTLMGGTIAVDSEPGEGSCFTATIPFGHPAAAVQVPPRSDTALQVANFGDAKLREPRTGTPRPEPGM